MTLNAVLNLLYPSDIDLTEYNLHNLHIACTKALWFIMFRLCFYNFCNLSIKLKIKITVFFGGSFLGDVWCWGSNSTRCFPLIKSSKLDRFICKQTDRNSTFRHKKSEMMKKYESLQKFKITWCCRYSYRIHRYIIQLIHSIYCKYVLSIFIFWYMFICSSVHLCGDMLVFALHSCTSSWHRTQSWWSAWNSPSKTPSFGRGYKAGAHPPSAPVEFVACVPNTYTEYMCSCKGWTCWLRWCDLMRRNQCFKLSASLSRLSVLSWLSILHLRPW